MAAGGGAGAESQKKKGFEGRGGASGTRAETSPSVEAGVHSLGVDEALVRLGASVGRAATSNGPEMTGTGSLLLSPSDVTNMTGERVEGATEGLCLGRPASDRAGASCARAVTRAVRLMVGEGTYTLRFLRSTRGGPCGMLGGGSGPAAGSGKAVEVEREGPDDAAPEEMPEG